MRDSHGSVKEKMIGNEKHTLQHTDRDATSYTTGADRQLKHSTTLDDEDQVYKITRRLN